MPSVSDHTTERGLWVQAQQLAELGYLIKIWAGEA